jgi:hypothetical protein
MIGDAKWNNLHRTARNTSTHVTRAYHHTAVAMFTLDQNKSWYIQQYIKSEDIYIYIYIRTWYIVGCTKIYIYINIYIYTDVKQQRLQKMNPMIKQETAVTGSYTCFCIRAFSSAETVMWHVLFRRYFSVDFCRINLHGVNAQYNCNLNCYSI